MRKVILYIAASLDGYIAKKDGNIDWLHNIPNPENLDFGYNDLYQSIDTTLMGYNTYKEIKGFDVPFPYPDKTNYVFSRQKRPSDEHVIFIEDDITEFVEELKNSDGKNIWLVGGGAINSVLMKGKLVDEIIQTVIPIALTNGIPLFSDSDQDFPLELINCESYRNGIVQLTYKPNN